MMKTIPHKSGWDFRLYKNKRGQRIPQKRKREKKEKEKKGERKEAIKRRKGPNKKIREKERRDNVTILLPHLCVKVAP